MSRSSDENNGNVPRIVRDRDRNNSLVLPLTELIYLIIVKELIQSFSH